MQDAGYKMQDARCRIMDAGSWVADPIEKKAILKFQDSLIV